MKVDTMNQQKIDEITQLSQGNEKDKKLALTYGYQPVIEKLKKDKNQEVVEFAQAIDANEDLKLFKNSLYFQQSKDRFQRYLTQATQYMYITLALIFIAMLSILIAIIIFFVNPETSVTTFIVITIIALIASVVLVMLSKKTEYNYNHSKQVLAQAQYLFNISKANAQSLQAQTENQKN